MKLSLEQQAACKRMVDWTSLFFNRSVPSPQQRHLVVGGHAGTGKTFLISMFSHSLRDKHPNHRIGFATLTGKASSVLAKKLKDIGSLYDDDTIGTIHGLIYRPVYEKTPTGEKVFKKWERKPAIDDIDLVVIDEGSMVNEPMWKDLTSYRIPIIIVGDHGQLPPIGGKFDIMKHPDILLNTVHRHDDELLKYAEEVRLFGNSGEADNFQTPKKTITKLDWNHPVTRKFLEQKIPWKSQKELPNFQVLCGMNNTRVGINNMIRNFKFESNLLATPYPGERLVCLRNNHSTKVMNGQMGTLKWTLPEAPDYQSMSIKLDDTDGGLYNTLSNMYCFGRLNYDGMWETVFQKNQGKMRALLKKMELSEVDIWDFGYAISVHRSQGSEWDKVILFVERNQYQNEDDWRRWLYTAVTRAKQRLIIIGNFR